MLKTKIRKLSATVCALALMLALTACSGNKEDYSNYKTDIIGMWCDIDGPEYVPQSDRVTEHYNMYEFTSDGRLIYHTPTVYGAIYFESTYEIKDNFLTVDGATCKLKVDPERLSMINNDGVSEYRKMEMQEVCDFGVIYVDNDNYNAQVEYTEAFSKNFPIDRSNNANAAAAAVAEE